MTTTDPVTEINIFCGECDGEHNHTFEASQVTIEQTKSGIFGVISVSAACPKTGRTISANDVDAFEGLFIRWDDIRNRMAKAGAKVIRWRAPEGVTSVRDL